jgi:hypothetical protein
MSVLNDPTNIHYYAVRAGSRSGESYEDFYSRCCRELEVELEFMGDTETDRYLTLNTICTLVHEILALRRLAQKALNPSER